MALEFVPPGAAAEGGGVLGALNLAAGVLLALGLPVFAFELFRLWRAGALTRKRIKGMLTSAFCLVPASVVEIALGGALLGLFFGAASLAPMTVATTPATALLCLLLVDFFYYWEHRLGHRVNLLWSAYHSVHHSADHFDQTIGLRISFVDFFVTPLIYLPLVFVGFDPFLILACFGVVLAWQQWIHTELVGKLAWLDPWLNTPSNHRVHHGRNPSYLDKNLGGILIIWDRLFGTYAPEIEPVDYGLVEPLSRREPWSTHFHVFGKMLKRLRSARTMRERRRILFGRPA